MPLPTLTLKHLINLCAITIAALVAFHIVLLVLWATRLLESHLFNLRNVGLATQITSVATQLWTIGLLVGITFAVQSIASDKIIRREQTIASMHDNLGAWQGIGAALAGLWRTRHEFRTALRVLFVLLFFLGVSLLHISTASVITINTFNATDPLSLTVSTPGKILAFVQSTDNTDINTITSRSYLWDQRNATNVGLPPGVDGTTLFSTLDTPLAGNVSFEDSNARDLNVKCGVIPRHPEDFFHIYYSGAGSKETFPEGVSLYAEVDPVMEPVSNLTVKFWSSALSMLPLMSRGNVFAVGGEKPSIDSPPTFWHKDIVSVLADKTAREAGTLPFEFEAGSFAFAYISARKDAIVGDPHRDVGPPVVRNASIHVWSWIRNESISREEERSRAFLEPLSFTLYIWPIACSLFVHNHTVTISGENKLMSKNYTASPTTGLVPFQRAEKPTDSFERYWAWLMWSTFAEEARYLPIAINSWGMIAPLDPTPFESDMANVLSNSSQIGALEEYLSVSSAFSLGLLIQFWRTSIRDSVPGSDALWLPVNATVVGRRMELRAGLSVHGVQLLISWLSLLMLIATSLSTVFPLSLHGQRVRNGRVIDMIALLRGSSIPKLIVRDSTISHDRRRQLAEGALIRYHPNKLDTPRSEYGTAISDTDSQGEAPADSSQSKVPADKESTQRSKFFHRIHRIFSKITSLRALYFAGAVVCLILASLYIALVTLYTTNTLHRFRFDINKIETITQFINVGSQVLVVTILAGLSFVVQLIVADKIMHRTQTVATLHDNLGAWRGFGTALISASQSGQTLAIRYRMLLALSFFASTAILQILTPSVLTVGSFNATITLSDEANTKFGLAPLVFNASTEDSLRFTWAAVPYLWDYRQTQLGLPAGLNGSVLFSSLKEPHSPDARFEDPYARELSIKCGLIPRSPGDLYEVSANITNNTLPAYSLRLTLKPVFNPIPNITMSTEQLHRKSTDFLRYQLGGPKKNLSSSPNFAFDDTLISLQIPSPFRFDLGVMTFAHVSIKNDSFSADSPIKLSLDTEVWSWVRNDSTSNPDSPGPEVPRFLEPLKATFYVWPIGCAIFIGNVSAQITGNNTLLSYSRGEIPIFPEKTPFIRSSQQDDVLQRDWAYLFRTLWTAQAFSDQYSPWIDQMLGAGLNETSGSVALLEDRLTEFSAFMFAVVEQHWRTTFANGDSNVSQWWSSLDVILDGTVPLLSARLQINALQLFTGCVCVLLLILAAAISVGRVKTYDGHVRDGGVIDMISLMHGSSLPEIITADGDSDQSEEAQRKRAEKTTITYFDSKLDVLEAISVTRTASSTNDMSEYTPTPVTRTTDTNVNSP